MLQVLRISLVPPFTSFRVKHDLFELLSLCYVTYKLGAVIYQLGWIKSENISGIRLAARNY